MPSSPPRTCLSTTFPVPAMRARLNVGSIMCSYNSLNGTPACGSTYLMNDILREHWGWKADNNYVTSDCNAVQVCFLPRAARSPCRRQLRSNRRRRCNC